ncbi:MAG: hypothetical protein ACSHXK_13205 [Oceanococcus sp.]
MQLPISIHRPLGFLLITIVLALTACLEGGRESSAISTRADEPITADIAGLWAGAAKVNVSPNQSQIDGEVEARLVGTTLQNFHLGGYGVGPLQNLPDPLNVDLTVPAGQTVYVNETGAEENIFVRVLILEDRDVSTRVALVSLDAIGAGNLIQNGVRAAVSEAAGVAPENILFGQTHTHAGPDLQGLWGGVPASWVTEFYLRAGEAAAQAAAALQPVELRLSQLETGEFNNYRRPRVFPDADADNTATLLRAYERESDVAVASLMQYSAHPTSVGSSNDPRIPHPDYVLGLVQYLERDGGTALYFNGAIADASGSGGGCDGDDYIRVRCRGEALAEAMLAASNEPSVITGPLSIRNVEAILPVTNPVFLAAAGIGGFNRYIDYGVVPLSEIPFLADQAQYLPQLMPAAIVKVSRVSFGDQLEIVTIPGETTNTFGEYIQSLAPGRPMMLLGLTQDSMGYILPEDEFSYIDPTGNDGLVLPFTAYEEFVSLGPLTAPLLRLQAYNPLFDAPPEANVPPALAACVDDSVAGTCLLDTLAAQLPYIQAAYAERCREQFGEDNALCALLDSGTP